MKTISTWVAVNQERHSFHIRNIVPSTFSAWEEIGPSPDVVQQLTVTTMDAWMTGCGLMPIKLYVTIQT